MLPELLLGVLLGMIGTLGTQAVLKLWRRRGAIVTASTPAALPAPGFGYDKRIDAMTAVGLERYQIHMANVSEHKRAQLRRDLYDKAASVLGWE